MIALGIVAAVLLLLALLRIGVSFEYGEAGICVKAFLGPLQVFSSDREKKPRRRKKPKKPRGEKRKPPEEAGEGKPGTLSALKLLLPRLLNALKRLKRRLLIKRLVVYYEAASENPASAACSFGYASAGLGILTPLLDNNFRVRRRELKTAVNFSRDEPYIYVYAKISLAVWEAVYIGFGVLAGILKLSSKRKKGKEDQHGKASAGRSDGDDHAKDPGDG